MTFIRTTLSVMVIIVLLRLNQLNVALLNVAAQNKLECFCSFDEEKKSLMRFVTRWPMRGGHRFEMAVSMSPLLKRNLKKLPSSINDPAYQC